MLAGAVPPAVPALLALSVLLKKPPATARLAQQLSLAEPQFAVPAPLTWQLRGSPQTPALQFGVGEGHAPALPHCPFAPQVSTALNEHCFCPGPHPPVQPPDTHV